MNYGQIITTLRRLIGRKNLTDEELKGYITMGLENLQREEFPPFLENLAVYESDVPLSEIYVPNDFLKLISLYCDHSELARADMPTFLRAIHDSGSPRMFVQQRGKMLLRPALMPGTILTMHYIGEDSPLIDPADVNGWSSTAANAIIYGAARHAALVFEDERGPTWDAAYQAEVQAIRDQVTLDRWSGPITISPGFEI